MRKLLPFALIMLFMIVAIGSFMAQPAIPLPSANSRAFTELLINGNFDIDTDGDKIPDDWTGKNINVVNSDKLKCNSDTKTFAHSAPCAFMFRGNPSGTTSKLTQTVTDTDAITDGSEVTFSVYLDARSGIPGAKIGVAKIIYSDGTSTKFTLTIPAVRSVEDYVQISDTQVIDIPNGATITKAKVDFRYNNTTGKFLIDDASFGVIIDELTTTPSNTTSATATTTLVVPTETNTPIDTATDTIEPTNTDTPPTATNTPTIMSQKLVASDGTMYDFFGNSFAIDGDTLAVGISTYDNPGAVYVFTRNSKIWTEQQKLTVSDAEYFGGFVAIDGDTLVVNASSYNRQGLLYVFTRNGMVWTEQQKLTASDGAEDEWFGDVAIEGDTLVVSAAYNGYQGAAYVFTRSGTIWTEQQKLIASDGTAAQEFGNDVKISGNTIVVGAWGDDIGTDQNHGAAYVFAWNGTSWTEQQKLTASDTATEDIFGSSVTIENDTIVVGAWWDDIGANSDQGSAYVFTRSGTVWTQQTKLTKSNGNTGDQFGTTDIEGNMLVVGSWGDDIGTNTNQGSAYIFTRSGSTWTQQQRLTAPDGAAQDVFGLSVAIYGSTIVVGSPWDDIGANEDQGSAYVFELAP